MVLLVLLFPDLQALRTDSLRRSKSEKRRTDYTKEHGGSWHTQHRDAEKAKEILLARRTAERQNGVRKRRYLTQPPDEYRQPAETAAVGVVGEKESANAGLPPKKDKGTIFRRLFGS